MVTKDKKEIEKHFLREQFFDNLKDSSKIISQMIELDLDKKRISIFG